MRHTPAVPYLYARPSRRPRHLRRALLAVVGACAVILALPAATPRGQVLDLVSDQVGQGAVAGQQPTAIAPGIAAAASPTPRASDPVVTPTPPGTAAAATMPPSPATPAPEASPSPASRTSPVWWPPRSAFMFDPYPVIGAPPIATLTGYTWPIAHPRLTLPFGPTVWGTRMVAGERFHDGVDLATFCGDRITAAHAGTVLAAGRHFDRQMGWVGSLEPYLRRLDAKHLWFELPIVVVIDDGNGYRSMYAHFGRIVVKRGQVVHAGQLLGYEGATGHASGCHLHYGLFSPLETATFRLRRDVAKRMKLPAAEIARIDPLLVLPPKPGINAPKVPKPRASAGIPVDSADAGS